jgi:hypothetical protein
VQINDTVFKFSYLHIIKQNLARARKLSNCCFGDYAPRARERKFNSHSGVLLKIMSRGSELPWREYCDHYNSALSRCSSWLLEAQIRPLLTGSLPGATIFRLPFTSKILVSALVKSPQKPAVSCHAGWRRRLIFLCKKPCEPIWLLVCFSNSLRALAPKLHANSLPQSKGPRMSIEI